MKDELLAKIERVCNAYPENFVCGYIISLIEGRPNAKLLEYATLRSKIELQFDLFAERRDDAKEIEDVVAAQVVPIHTENDSQDVQEGTGRGECEPDRVRSEDTGRPDIHDEGVRPQRKQDRRRGSRGRGLGR